MGVRGWSLGFRIWVLAAETQRAAGLPHEIHQEDESRRLFQLTFDEIDRSDTKSISLNEWLDYYCPGEGAMRRRASVESCEMEVHSETGGDVLAKVRLV